MKIEECWLQIEIVGRRMREEWQQEQHQMPSDRALSLSLSHEREHEEAAAVLCFVVSLLVLLYHHLSCSCALIHSYSLSRTSTLSLSQCCTLDSLLRITIACLDSLNQSIDILLLLLWSAEQIVFVFVLLVLQS